MKLFIDSSLHSKIGKFLSGLNPSISISSSSLPQATEFPVLQIKEGTQISGLVDVSKEVINSSHSLQHLLGSNENDKKEVDKGIKFVVKDFIPLFLAKDHSFTGKLHKLNKDLATTTFFVGHSLTLVDLLLFPLFHELVNSWPNSNRVLFRNLTRWFDFTQHQELLHFCHSTYPLLTINKNLPVLESETKSKAKEPSKEQKPQQNAQEQKPQKVPEQKPQQKAQEKSQPQQKSSEPNATIAPENVNIPSDADLNTLSALYLEQGQIVRGLKEKKADPTLIKSEVDKLLKIKEMIISKGGAVPISSAQPQQKKEEKKEEKKADKPEEKKENNEEKKGNNEGKKAKKEDKKAPTKGKSDGKGDTSAPERPLDISRVDIRVGKIVDVKVLEGSDKLYIEQIDVGEEKPRQILSGLRLFVPLEEMKDRLVLVVCNLEPRSMAKTLSYGMVLAASNQDHTVVELVNPPPNSKIGERVTFDGYSGEPDTVLNSKKKHFDIIAEDLHTTDTCEAAYKTSLFKTSAGICSVKSLKNEKIK